MGSCVELARGTRCGAIDDYGITGSRYSSEALHFESIDRGDDFVMLWARELSRLLKMSARLKKWGSDTGHGG